MIEGMGIWHNVFDRLGAGSKRMDPRIKHSQPFAFGTESIPQHDELVKMTDVGSSRK